MRRANFNYMKNIVINEFYGAKCPDLKQGCGAYGLRYSLTLNDVLRFGSIAPCQEKARAMPS